MKRLKHSRRLALNRETLRDLDALNAIRGGYDHAVPATVINTDQTSFGCSQHSVCGCPTNACSYGTHCQSCPYTAYCTDYCG